MVAIYPATTSAEYRVFQLRITKIAAQKPAETPAAAPAVENTATSFREVLSTLDPEQYRGYYQVAPDEEVKYVATWRCYGRTNGRDLCPNPKANPENPQNP